MAGGHWGVVQMVRGAQSVPCRQIASATATNGDMDHDGAVLSCMALSEQRLTMDYGYKWTCPQL